MDVYTVDDAGLRQHEAGELSRLLEKPDAVVWVDIPLCETVHATLLTELFGFADVAVRDCVERNHISKIHVYDDHAFTVLHAPELGRGGHVHYVELDQFVGPNYVVTVHGPLNPVVPPSVAAADTGVVVQLLRAGKITPQSPMELSHGIVSSLIRREIDLVAALARECGQLEQRVTDDDHNDDPEDLLEDLFEVSHQLLAIRTIATHSAETYRSIAHRSKTFAPEDIALVTELADRFEMVRSMAQGQREFVHGVIEFFQTRTSTHLAISAQNLADESKKQNDQVQRITAWVAIIAVPTAVTGFFGQNVPYPGFGDRAGFIASTTIIIVAAIVLYIVFKLKKWL